MPTTHKPIKPLAQAAKKTPKVLSSAPRAAVAPAAAPVLLWLARDVGITGKRELGARTVAGAYVIFPNFDTSKRRMGGKPWPFLGFEVRCAPLSADQVDEQSDDPSWIDDDEVRVIATGVQTETEAKVIAQADADAQARDRT